MDHGHCHDRCRSRYHDRDHCHHDRLPVLRLPSLLQVRKPVV
ncbi:hypothetical protein FGA82_00445 [Pseudomonas fluorescens]|nr:hypothetical protein FGA82_00445 [Pseudomonas fluorescens]